MGMGTAFKAFFAALLNKETSARIQQALAGETAAADAVKALPERPAAPPKEPQALDPRAALILLAELQKQGRLLDFLNENLDGLEDADIGMAVREVHRGCKSALEKYFELAPVREEDEGRTIEVPKGFDPAQLRIIGSAGEPPFAATLQHRGWKAQKINLPTVMGTTADHTILAPAEVEHGA